LEKLHFPKSWRLIPLVLVSTLYIMMTGMEPPVLRAGLMLFCYLLGENLDAKDQPLNRLSFAALVLLVMRPNNLFEIGFQLSIMATLGIVVIYPALAECFSVKQKWLKPIWKGLLVSSAAQLAILPLLVNYFQQIAWSSPVVNLLLMIPAEIVVVGGLLGESLSLLLPWLGWFCLKIVDLTLNLIRLLVHLIGSQSWAAGFSPSWTWCWMLGYYLALVLLWEAWRPNLISRHVRDWGLALVVFLILLNLVVWLQLPHFLAEPALKITMLNVGQGDAIFVQAPDGARILIDGGDVGEGKAQVLPFLRKEGVERLDLVLGTHGHRDHLGGLSEVLVEIPTEKLLLPVPQTDDAQVFLRQLKRLRLKPTFCSKMRFRFGNQVIAQIISLPEAEDENDRSLVLALTYGKNQILLTGDLTEKGEAILYKQYPEYRKLAILKVGHHGSQYSTTLPFLTQVRPKIALISVGKDNRYGHPGTETLKRLYSLGIPIYRTDRQGQIDLALYLDRIIIKGAGE